MVVLHPTIGTTVVSTPNSGAVPFVTGCGDFFLGAGRTRRSPWVLTASGLASGTAPTTVTAVEFPAKSEAAGPVPHLRTRRRRPRRPIHIGPGTVESPLGPRDPSAGGPQLGSLQSQPSSATDSRPAIAMKRARHAPSVRA